MTKETTSELKLFYDIETFPNYFLVVGQLENSDDYIYLENPSYLQLYNFINKGRLIGFNNHKFDDVVLASVMNKVQLTKQSLNESIDPKWAYDMAQEIINSDLNVFFTGLPQTTDDVMKYRDFETSSLNLKSFESALGMDIIEANYSFHEDLDEQGKKAILKYCTNDVLATRLAYEYLHDKGSVNAVEVLREYVADKLEVDINSISKSSTNSLMIKLFPNPSYNRQDMFDYIERCNLSHVYADTEFMTWYDAITEWEDARNNVENLSKTAPVLKMKRHGVDYVFGSGGVHGLNLDHKISSKCTHNDYSSLYPNIMININALGEETSKFAEIVKTRVSSKKNNKKLAVGLKLAINSLYGICRSKTSGAQLYDPYLGLDVCIVGQTLLYELALRYVEAGATIINVNTDGIILKDDGTKAHKEKLNQISREFETSVNLILDGTDMPYVVQKDVNNYFVLDETFSIIKTKGVFGKKPYYNNHASSKYVMYQYIDKFKGNGKTSYSMLDLYRDNPDDFILRAKVNRNFLLHLGIKETQARFGKSGIRLKHDTVMFIPLLTIGQQFRGYATKKGLQLMNKNLKTSKFIELSPLKTGKYKTEYTLTQPSEESVDLNYYLDIAQNIIDAIETKDVRK